MKHFTFISVFLTAMFALAMQAQTPETGDRFFDGRVLYTVQQVRNGAYIYMTGEDAVGNYYEMTLHKVHGKKGEFTLEPSAQADEPPIANAEFGWRVQYVRQNGMYFLAVRKPKSGDAMHILVLTPDNLEHCIGQEQYMEVEEDPLDLVSHALLYTTYLQRIPRPMLRLMRNTILARHGYRFESKELQGFFNAQEWYKPGKSNKNIKLSIIEQTNLELIKSEEALPVGEHPADNQPEGVG